MSRKNVEVYISALSSPAAIDARTYKCFYFYKILCSYYHQSARLLAFKFQKDPVF